MEQTEYIIVTTTTDSRAVAEQLAREVLEARFRGEDAKIKSHTMSAYWVPGVNNLGQFGRWAFEEFTAVYEIEADFGKQAIRTWVPSSSWSISVE